MSHFYATIDPTKSGGRKVTKCGTKNSGVTVRAASYSGAVRVILSHNEQTGIDNALVELVPWLGNGTHSTLYDGPVGKFAPKVSEVA